MKTKVPVLIIGLLGGLAYAPQSAEAALEVSASVSISARTDFEAPLAAHGSWLEVRQYGRCWHPAGVEVSWRPYCAGEWVWTDCGWYWQSEEPWAWACYHYGRWLYTDDYGWVWVPDVEWAPAWVEWRFGGGYCGWAPCAPRGVVIAARTYVFVDAHHFNEPVRPGTVIVNNETIVAKTRGIGGFKHESRTLADGRSQKVVVAAGPKVEDVQIAVGHKLNRLAITEAAARNQPSAEAVAKIHREHGQPPRELDHPEKDRPGIPPQTPPAASPPPSPIPAPPSKSTPPASERRFFFFHSKPQPQPPAHPATSPAPAPAPGHGPDQGQGDHPRGNDREGDRHHD